MRKKRRLDKRNIEFKINQPLREITFTKPSGYGWTTVKKGRKKYIAYTIPWRR